MSRCGDTLKRRNKVNPSDEQTIGGAAGRWEERVDVYSPTSTPAPDVPSTSTASPEDTEPSGTLRKSSKAKRVKSYLKKCKDAALGKEEEVTAPSVTVQEVPRRRRSKRRTNSGNREVSSTSWYVAETAPVACPLPLEVKQGVEVFDEGALEEKVEALNLEDDFLCPSQSEAVETLRPGLDGPGDVLDSRTEGGTSFTILKSEPPDEPVAKVTDETEKAVAYETDTDVAEEEFVDAETDECETISEEQSLVPVAEARGDVASLVDRLLGPIFPNFSRTRSILIRQARDLLVCTFHGNLVSFERDFLQPASELLAQLIREVSHQGGDAVCPRGWPLTLGAAGVVLQLGELDPSLLRTRDCYLCVRGAGAVELAVVWRGDSAMGSQAVAKPRCLDTVLGMELALAEADGLPTLLQSLLVSVERALERIPLDDLAFPCPQCREPCVCACPPVVQKRDTSIQTSPMFEFAGAIPHIDSDDEVDYQEDGMATQTPSVGTSSTVIVPHTPEVLIPPKSITELPEKLLMSGINLSGTHDLEDRPLILVDSTAVVKSGLDRHQVATLLLYYASIPRPDRLHKGFAVLLLSGVQEAAVLELLDKALVLVQAYLRVGRFLVWRPSASDISRSHLKTGSSCQLEETKIPYLTVSSEHALRNFISEDQAPACCGGRSNHDQLEWVEFHKEVEPFSALCYQCGRRLASVMCELRAADCLPPLSRRQLHQQHRALTRALAEPELQRLRREGIATLNRLQERAQWLPASEDVRLSTERARRLFAEVDRAARRLEQLCEARRERLRDIARLRALEEESSQVLSWLCKKGEETLRRHAELATNLSAIKEQEQDFEKFYFISMRHLDKGSDLLEEASQCSGDGPPYAPPSGRSSSGGGLRELARSLKQHLLGFSERLEDTRERLEDTSRCFYLLDKAYEWALETMKYISRMKVDDAQTPDQTLQLLKHLQQYLMAHPPISEEHFTEMLQLARKLANDKLLEQAKVAHSRCQETMELIREKQSRLLRTRQQLGIEEDSYSAPTAEDLELNRPMSPKAQHLGWCSGAATSTPIGGGIGRRRSVGSFPYIYKCSHHAAGHACSCFDPTPPPSVLDESGECCCAHTRPNNLGNIQEVRESAEDLLDDVDEPVKSDESVCGRCSSVSTDQRLPLKRHLRRSCTWQYPTENFDDEDALCENGRLCGSRDNHKCEYSTDNMGDIITETGEGCPKSGDDLEDQEGSSKPVPPVPVNSHLHCHASSLDLQSSLAAASTKELKTHKTLLLIMREMIQTERDYVKSLEYIIENYIPELLREDIPQALRGQRNVIFGNVEKIFEFHSQYFLQELERCENCPLMVGQCFLRHEKKFYLYALYNKNKPKSDSLMSEYGSMFFKAKQMELGDKMDLASYLLKPVQRMGKYALLLQQLMKAYPDKEADVADIKAAEQMVRFQLRHGNDLLAMDSLRDCDVNVKEQGRLLRQNEFLVWQGKGKKCLRHVFLFEELILFSKARRFPDRKNLDLYIYKNSIKMTDIGLTAKIGDSPTKFEIWFRKRKPNDTFTLQSMSEEIKQAWTEEISKLLWKQALRNREMRLAEMSSMGIGNKPCLDIRPSADQISDRSISIAQLSKTAPRFRNLITVSSGDLLRSNKRPHSIISVSSSSSSGGSSSTSHSSASNYGALVNLGFDPVDSPHMHHRSTTLHSQCSTESGIIADISLGSEDTDGSHWHVERSNSSVTSMSLDSSMSPTSPVSPTEEDKTCLISAQSKESEGLGLNEPDQEELSIKL